MRTPNALVELTATIEANGTAGETRVFDLSQGGARLAFVSGLTAGACLAVRLPGTRALTAPAWITPSLFGVRFEPAMLDAGRGDATHA